MPRSTASGSHKDEFVALANELFQKFHIVPVRSLSECEPSSFVTLYEGILGDRLKDVIRSPVTREDEIHNVQCMIESLSRDVLHCDLSHITGQAIVDRDIVSIQYLLEILEGLVDYVMEQIGSETSSEIDDFQPLQEVSCHSEKAGSGRQKRDRSNIKTRSLESISLPSSISPHPDAEELSEGSNSTAELIRLGEESASYRRKHTVVKHDKKGDLNSTYQKSGLSEMFDSYGISEGRLSQLTDTTLKDTTISGQEPMSGSFSTITWPKAPSTASSPSPASKPAASSIRSRPAHTKAFMAEKMSPYNSLLRSLTADFSGVDRSRGYQKGKPATTTVHTESSATKGYTPKTTIDQPRRSLRLTPQATATSAPLHQGSRHKTPQQENKLESGSGKYGSSPKRQRPSQRRSPRFTQSAGHGPRVPLMSAGQPLEPHGKEVRYPAKLPQPDSQTRVRHVHSPPVRGSPAKSVRTRYPVKLRQRHEGENLDHSSPTSRRRSGAAIAATYPAKLLQNKASPGARRYIDAPTGQEVASSAELERYATRLPHHHVSSATGRYSDSPSRQELPSTTEQESYPAMLPPYSRTSIPSITSDVSSIRQSPGIASRLRRSARRSLDQEKRETKRGREDSSFGADVEDSYDRSFMRRKVARRRRVAFEDEERQHFSAEGSDEERPSQRFRFCRESDEENDITDPSYSHLTWYTGSGREDQSRTDSEEEVEEEEEEGHSYDLRTRKKTDAVKGLKGHDDKSHRQHSVLLPRSLPQRREPLKVQFEDAMNRDAKGLLSKVRRKLADEASHQSKMKDVLRYTYEDNLREVKRGVKQQVTRRKKVTKQLDEDYKALHGKPKTTQYRPAKKYTAPVSATEGSRRPSRSTKRTPASKRKRVASSSPTSSQFGIERPLRIGDDDLLPTLMHEFPFLHVSPHTAQRMWAQQMKHMEHLTKAAISQKYKKPKTQSKIEEAERKQEILVNIMKKELAHNQRLRDIKERRNQERALQTKAKEQRQVNARARRYYDEYRVKAKSRALKRRTKEEQIFKHLFEEGMAIQKMRIRELREYAKEKRENNTKQQQDEVESLENYYRDQFNLLAETISKERHDLNVGDRAQANAMKRLKSDMRRKMEKEIREYQEQLYRDEDAEYFRQLEADRMKHELQMAKYKAQL